MNAEVWSEIHKILQELGPPVLSLLGVLLGWRLGHASQQHQRRIDALDRRLDAYRQLKHVLENVPDVTAEALLARLQSDPALSSNLQHRLARLFGLRVELVPYLDPSIAKAIDQQFSPAFRYEAGSCELVDLQRFATSAVGLLEQCNALESKLVREYERLSR